MDVDTAGEDDDVEFFRGRLPLAWIGGRGGGLVFFSGRTGQTVLVMGGSERHLISAPPDPADSWRGTSTNTPLLIRVLSDWTVHTFGGVDGAPTLERPLEDASGQPLPPGARLPSRDLATLVVNAYARAHALVPEVKMTFLAVPLAAESLETEPLFLVSDDADQLVSGATRALLAAPLYVSLKR